MKKMNVWMSVADLMSGLMIIFLFIAVAYLSKVNENQSKLTDYVDNKRELHGKLIDEFRSEEDDGELSIRGDLTMRFENAETLFASGSWELTDKFKTTLDKVIPKYLDILLNDSLQDKIKEIRIEGHTDAMPYPQLNKDPYLANLILSQRRALNVMAYIRRMPYVQQLDPEKKRKIEYWFTANGMSYGRAVGKDGSDDALLTGKPVDYERSRRVDIRIVTRGDEVLNNFVEKNKLGKAK